LTDTFNHTPDLGKPDSTEETPKLFLRRVLDENRLKTAL
jgi:hypothetical protein